ncbi:MAG: hypothetical protein ACI4HI_07675 [Lachnospiraceae bacterium]
MLRKQVRNGIAVLQSALIFGLILPLVYALGIERSTQQQQKIYLVSFLVALPVIGTAWTIRKCKTLPIYIVGTIVCGGISVLVGKGVASACGLPNYICVGLMLVIGIVTAFAGVDRYWSRINRLEREKKREEKDPSWRPALRLLEYPKWNTMFYFLLLYVVGKNFNSPVFCNEVFGNAFCYLFLLLFSHYLEQTEEYFFVHHHIKNLPSKRIYGISVGMLAIFCCLMLVAVIPSAAASSRRQYRDFRAYVLELDTREPDPMLEEAKKFKKQKPDPEREAIEKIKQKKAPWWEEALFRVIGVVLGGSVLILAGKKLREMFLFFRESADENGDEVETLQEINDSTVQIKKAHRFFPKTEEERVRAQYRKMIRKHRKDRPKPAETPTEMEQLADVYDTPQGKELHVRYEQVRYGKRV